MIAPPKVAFGRSNRAYRVLPSRYLGHTGLFSIKSICYRLGIAPLLRGLLMLIPWQQVRFTSFFAVGVASLSACGGSSGVAGSTPISPTGGPKFGIQVAQKNIASGFVTFPLPTAWTNASLDAIVAAPDHNIWFLEKGRDRVGRVTNLGAFVDYPVSSGAGLSHMTIGHDNNLWFTETGLHAIGRMTTHGILTEFPLPSDAAPNGIASGPDFNLWYTDATNNSGPSRIGRITTAGTVLASVPISWAGSVPNQITVGPDSNMWFTDQFGLGQVTVSATPTTTQYPFATGVGPITVLGTSLYSINPAGPDFYKTSFGSPTTATQVPWAPAGFTGISAGPDGNLWLTSGGVLGHVSAAGADLGSVALPMGAAGTAVTAGPDGNMWVAQPQAISVDVLRLQSVTPTSIAFFSVPSPSQSFTVSEINSDGSPYTGSFKITSSSTSVTTVAVGTAIGGSTPVAVTPVGAGTATITISDRVGNTSTITVTVTTETFVIQ